MSFDDILTTIVQSYTTLETSIGAVARLKTFSDTVTPETGPTRTSFPKKTGRNKAQSMSKQFRRLMEPLKLHQAQKWKQSNQMNWPFETCTFRFAQLYAAKEHLAEKGEPRMLKEQEGSMSEAYGTAAELQRNKRSCPWPANRISRRPDDGIRRGEDVL
ncbi:uncharacterized protein ColSpa_12555 [Colletotrichum spaethianum]|uniref:Uncharacterized protein n=1 Tax=Colletotrichum spaethianum TaxID=700344 RepID=A0AA37PHQ3_9PEZI|nr:uncharacterized protein ColSpa_12555 [Colletotrichum spaethianum]GKT52374.1 hypothetical protein ColSpa_12555 [Colletotrichum spaethianum]